MTIAGLEPFKGPLPAGACI